MNAAEALKRTHAVARAVRGAVVTGVAFGLLTAAAFDVYAGRRLAGLYEATASATNDPPPARP